MGNIGIRSIGEFDYKGKTVILRLDINSPIDPVTKKIVNENRINKSADTVNYLLNHGAKVAIIAHQGDTLDYQNLIPLSEHAEILSGKCGKKINYIDDVCGPAACNEVKKLKEGEAIILGNLRYLCEEISTFEDAVKLAPHEMLDTYLLRSLSPLADFYVNDAFAAAHRNSPSMVAFQQLLPSAAGPLFFNEVSALTKVLEAPEKPSLFLLGGAKISDAYGMMKQVLSNGTADKVLCTGVVGEVMLMAKGINLGELKTKWIYDRSLDKFLEPSKEYLEKYGDKIELPVDLAFEENGKRSEVSVEDLPLNSMFMDIGEKTIRRYSEMILNAATIFVNGPSGAYEKSAFEDGTKYLWRSVEDARGYSVIGGGDSVSAASKYCNLKNFDYICTAGGAMVRFLSGVKLPLIEAMRNSK